MTHITRARFSEVFDGKYCRPSSLRQLVYFYKAQADKAKQNGENSFAPIPEAKRDIDIQAASVRSLH